MATDGGTGDEDRKARAEVRRRTATLHKTRLQDVEADPSPLRGAEAIALVDSLTLTSWSLARRPLPTYSRAHIPVRFVAGRLT